MTRYDYTHLRTSLNKKDQRLYHTWKLTDEQTTTNNRDPKLCAYCGCPLTDELDVNHSRCHDEQTDTDCCAPACADGIRRFMAGERTQTVEDARCAILRNA